MRFTRLALFVLAPLMPGCITVNSPLWSPTPIQLESPCGGGQASMPRPLPTPLTAPGPVSVPRLSPPEPMPFEEMRQPTSAVPGRRLFVGRG